MKKYLLSIAFLLSFMALMAQQLPSELNKGLVFHAPLNEWFPTKDLVSGTNGTATAVYNVADRQGSGANRHFEYDGVNDYVDCGTSTSLNPGTGNWSLITRIKTTSTSTQGIYTCTDGTTNDVVYLRMEASGALRGRWEDNGVAKQVLTSTTYNDGSWHSICFKVDRTSATGMKIIVDNVEASYTTQDDPTSLTGSVSPTGTKYLGIWFDGSAYPFSGSISLVRIFNYALTPTQIANYSKPEYPIEWVDRGATGTNLLAGYNLTNWETNATVDNSTTFHGTDFWVRKDGIFETGRKYIMYASGTATVGALAFYNYGIANLYGSVSVSGGNWTKNANIYTSTDTGISCYSTGTGSITISNLAIYRAGCVLDLNSSGLSRASDGSYNTGYWTDRTNSITATVSGATSVIPPASCLGGTWFTEGKLTYSGISGLPTGSSDRTISFDLLVSNYNYYQGLVNYGSTASHGLFGIYLTVNTGYLFCEDYTINASAHSTNVIPLNTWTKVCVIVKSGTIYYYINGVLDGTATMSGMNTSGTDLYIGAEIGSPSYKFSGVIKNVRIINRAIDTDGIKLLNDIN